MTTSAPMLSVRGLCKRFGKRSVLHGVDLSLAKGQVGVLIGPSGTGKSTLLRCINGLETFDDGEIAFDDLRLRPDLTNHEKEQRLHAIRQRAGMVFQSFNLFPNHTVLQNVIEAPLLVLKKPRDQAVSEAVKLLDRVGLADRLESYPRHLSGGQQQRVAIARALAMKPELMLFDEPTSALDPQMTAEVLAVMTDLAKEGQTMLVVTHAMNFARRVANTVFVMHGGGVGEHGHPEEIFGAPKHPGTQAFLKEVEKA